MEKLDILAVGAHPDDIELGCGGTVISHVEQGFNVGLLDLTQGELGTRGSAELRLQEAAKAAEILGVTVRENLGMADGFFVNDKEHQLQIIQVLRRHQPDVVFATAIRDRHIDHGRASKLISDACFLSGLRRIETTDNGVAQEAWRPKSVYHYIQDRYIEPDVIVDISEYWDRKQAAIQAFGSQFYNPNSKEPTSPIATKEFLENVKARAYQHGRTIGAKFGEGFTVERTPGVKDLVQLM